MFSASRALQRLFPSLSLRWLRLALIPLLLGAVAACDEPFQAQVSRFQSRLPPPQGQSFFILPEDPRMAGGIEFGQYSRYVAGQMIRLGYTEVGSPDAATLLVRFGYGVDHGRQRISTVGADPFWGPWHGYAGFGYGGGFYGRRGGFYGGFGGGYGGGFGGPWNYGWYDPWFGGVDSYTVYTSGISVKIAARDGHRLFEGRAEAASTSNRLPYLVPNLVDAMFTGFPGDSGSTVRITVAPETKH